MIRPDWNVDNVAEYLNVAPSWVYSKAESGELPSFKIGRYRRFDPDEIEAWLEKQRQGSNGATRHEA